MKLMASVEIRSIEVHGKIRRRWRSWEDAIVPVPITCVTDEGVVKFKSTVDMKPRSVAVYIVGQDAPLVKAPLRTPLMQAGDSLNIHFHDLHLRKVES